MNSEVDKYIYLLDTWQDEVIKLRSILLNTTLDEQLKWKVPCYTYNKSNVALIGVFKDYCTISFFKGVLLKDDKKILVAPGENSQSVRMLKITSVKEINRLQNTITSYIFEAIEIEKAGLKVEFQKNNDLVLVEELKNILEQDSKLKFAFKSLTPGRQRGYNLYFSGAKQSKSRISRIEKYKSRILDGKGIHDCICGLSKRMPKCDGSHNALKN